MTPSVEVVKPPEAQKPLEGPDRLLSIEDMEAALKAADEDMGQVEKRSAGQMETLGHAVTEVPEGAAANQGAENELSALKAAKMKELMDVMQEEEFTKLVDQKTEEAEWETGNVAAEQEAAGLAYKKQEKEAPKHLTQKVGFRTPRPYRTLAPSITTTA